jgi:hypothetical protein
MILPQNNFSAGGFSPNCLRRFEAGCRTVERGLAMFGRKQNDEHLTQRSQGRRGRQRTRNPPISPLSFIFVVFVPFVVYCCFDEAKAKGTQLLPDHSF